MKRPIKFRGRVCDENKAQSDQGKTVYGNCLFQYPNGTVALSHTIKLALTFVEPESVAQLVGYDCDGREVYEGDVLIDVGNGTEWIAVLSPAVTLPKYEHLENSNLELSMLKLKEV